MPGWILLLIGIAIIAAVAFIALRSLRSRNATVARTEADAPARDYREERESSRLSGMSDEDRAWEAASRERSRNAQQAERSPSNEG